MITITRKLEFDAGHRVLGHESKCAHLHGHRYVCEITVEAPELDNLGRVIDFSVVKRDVGTWIDDNWDHNMLLHPQDPMWMLWNEWWTTAETEQKNGRTVTSKAGTLISECSKILFGNKKPYEMKYGNPTAENIACELYAIARDMLGKYGIFVNKVVVWETPNCKAEYTPG